MRLATFNILHGRSLHDGRVDIQRFADAVRELDADVLALQEVDRQQPRSQHADLTAVAADVMGAVAHRFGAALAGTPGATWIAATGAEQPGSAEYGIALLSRLPAHSWQVTRMPPIPFAVPMFLPGPRKFAIVREEPRVAVSARILTRAGELTVVNTHLSFVPGWNRLQLRRLVRDVQALPDPLILMGDLNLRGQRAATISRFRPLATIPTFPTDAPTHQLDHALLRRGTPRAQAYRAVRLPLSDHRALVIDLVPADLSRPG
jgi:endonuclease/exonuclease/phosphatase family metal-dependent hydrolase